MLFFPLTLGDHRWIRWFLRTRVKHLHFWRGDIQAPFFVCFVFKAFQNDCEQWLQPWNWKMLAPLKETYNKTRQHIKKQRYHFANKGPYSQGLGPSNSYIQMWELDHKEAEHQRIDAFKLWCWRRFLRIPWTARKSNQSILKEISPEYSLEGLMLKLKLHLIRRTDSFEKTLMLGKIEGRRKGDDRGWDCWMASLTQWTWVWANSGS